MSNQDLTESRNGFVRALPELSGQPVWRVVCACVRTLSLRLGCPSANQDPLECIAGMHVQISLNTSRIRETRVFA